MSEAAAAIIGVLPGPTGNLPEPGLESAVRQADLLAGAERHLALFPDAGGERFDYIGRMKELAERMQNGLDAGERVVVLATGDPMFFGIGSLLIARLGSDRIRVHPHRSTMQMAFARAGVAWSHAALVSVHNRPLSDLLAAAGESDTLGVFTDPDNHPGRIAAALEDAGHDFHMTVHALGDDGEQVWQGTLTELRDATYPDPNTVVLRRRGKRAVPARLGHPDADFAQRQPDKGLITKREVRSLALALLRLAPADTVWDIGAGSGAVAVEAARLASSGVVHAVEKNSDDVANIAANRRTFGVGHVHVHEGRAPDALAELPDPDAVFVGGSGGEMATIAATAWQRLRPGGRLVITAVLLETLEAARTALAELGAEAELTQLQASRSQPLQGQTRLAAQNPVFLVHATKETSP